MECRQCAEQFADLLDGSLSEDETRQMAVHLDACPACRLLWTQYQGLVTELHTATPIAVRAGFADQVVARVSAERRRPRGQGLSRLLVLHGRLAAAAVVVLIGLAVGAHLMHRPDLGASEQPIAVAVGSEASSVPLDEAATGSAEPGEPPSGSDGSAPSAASSARGLTIAPGPVVPPAPPAPSLPDPGVVAERAWNTHASSRSASAHGGASPAPSDPGSIEAAEPEHRDAGDSAADRKRAAMNLIGGTEGMSTSFSSESLERARARQMIRENPYSNAAPEKWTDPSRTHHNFAFEGTRLSIALDSVAKTGNIRIIQRGPITGNVTVNMQNARPEAALERIAGLANLRVTQQGDTYVVEQGPHDGASSATRPAEVRPPD